MFCVAYWVNMPLIEQTDALKMYVQCLLSSIQVGSTSIGHARHVKTRNDNVLRILIFSQKLPFSVGKNNVSKTNLGSTIHYTYTSYNKYSRLCMVSEELRLNEISLFRYCDVYRVRNLLNRIHTRGIFASMSQITGSLFYYTEIQYSLYKTSHSQKMIETSYTYCDV